MEHRPLVDGKFMSAFRSGREARSAKSRPTIQIFDPALCCSTGVCGADIDQALVELLRRRGLGEIEWRENRAVQLAQQPMAFAENTAVKNFLERSGQEALPLVLVNGEVALAGRYPNRIELARWAGISPPSAETKSCGSCCSGSGCC